MTLTTLLPLFKVASVFGLVILLMRLSSQVGLALIVGAVSLGFFFQMSPQGILIAFGLTFVDGKFLLVVLIVSLIIVLSASMEQLGQMREILGRFRNRIGSKRWGMAALPALIGLLPMPGGAIFSAPMVDAFDEEGRLPPSLKSFLNYWYRHIWEYWWPLYPSVLLACALAEVDLWAYIAFACPLTGIAAAGGLTQLLQIRRFEARSAPEVKEHDKSRSLSALLPVALAIFTGLSLGILHQSLDSVPGGFSLPKETGLVLGLLAAIAWVWWHQGIRRYHIVRILRDPLLVRMGMTLIGVFVFKNTIQESLAAQEVAEALMHLNVPLGWMIVLFSATLGVITGLPVAFVAITFPVLVPVIEIIGTPNMRLPLIILVYLSGFTGSLLSPLHLCMILSNEYFGAPWLKFYQRLWLPMIMSAGGGLCYFWLLSLLVG
jgi:integral membrane protein (TIGR00529 family)